MPDCRAAALLAGFVLAVAPVRAEMPAAPMPVTYFTDNGDRVALAKLRARDPATLSDADRMVLDAANRLGWIEVDGCKKSSNGILIRIGDRDAVLTSRHFLFHLRTGKSFCDPEARLYYQPNAAYLPGDAARAKERVALMPDPLTSGDFGARIDVDEDWLIYPLEDRISDLPMPEGSWNAGLPRGAIHFSAGGAVSGAGVVIGFDGRFAKEQGWQMSTQPCRYVQTLGPPPLVAVDCDVSSGASSSFFGVEEAGELRLLGMISRSSEGLVGTDVPVPGSARLWNQAVMARGIYHVLATEWGAGDPVEP